jgi:hypothetical protein
MYKSQSVTTVFNQNGHRLELTLPGDGDPQIRIKRVGYLAPGGEKTFADTTIPAWMAAQLAAWMLEHYPHLVKGWKPDETSMATLRLKLEREGALPSQVRARVAAGEIAADTAFCASCEQFFDLGATAFASCPYCE